MSHVDYFMLVNGEQSGPFSAEQVRGMLQNNEIDASALVWTEGQETWVPVGSRREFTSSFSSEASNATPSSESESSSVLTVGEKLKTSAKLTAAQAKLEKLRRIDLRSALRELGKSAFESSLDVPGLSEHYEVVRSSIGQIRALRETPPETDAATALDKARSLAGKGKQALEIESLGHRRDHAFVLIGETVSGLESVPAPLDPPFRRVQQVRKDISGLEREIQSLQSQVSGLFARPGVVLLAVAAVGLMIVGWNFVAPRYRNWEAVRESRKQQAIFDAESRKLDAEIEAESKRLERESLARQREMEEEDRIATAKQKKELLAQELELKEEELARDLAVKQAEAQERLEQETRRLDRAAAEAEMERQRAEKEKKASEEAAIAQKERAALAAKLLSKVSFSPNVTLSGKLQQLGATIEMRGENIDDLVRLQRASDWLGMLGAIRKTALEDYPDADAIERSVDQLKARRFKVLLRTSFQETTPTSLHSAVFPIGSSHRVISTMGRWERHPDGIGYLRDWSPDDGPLIVIAGNYETVGSHLREAAEGYNDDLQALKEKRSLGELTDDSLEESVRSLRARAHREISHWALSK